LPACIQQLTKLQKLEIRGSQELKKWGESEENKTKLAHINIVQVSPLPSYTISYFRLQVFSYTTMLFLFSSIVLYFSFLAAYNK
jgi:hypothetical protein